MRRRLINKSYQPSSQPGSLTQQPALKTLFFALYAVSLSVGLTLALQLSFLPFYNAAAVYPLT